MTSVHKLRGVKGTGVQFSNTESQKMSKEPEQRHIFIYLTSLIHWVGAGVTIGLLYSLFNIPVIAVVSLLILCFLVLPPIVRVVDGDEPDEQ